VEKLIIPSLHPELVAAAEGVLATTFADVTPSTIKSAANNTFTEEMLGDLAPPKDQALIHLVALGDHETYGPNRNCDAFTAEANQKYHHTFEKHAHVFQEHKNKDPKTAIGTVKRSAYNPEMKRVELAIWLDKAKAPKEYEMAKEGKQLSFSMSCKIKEDVCSICGNKSATAHDYCEHLQPGSRGKWHGEHEKFAFMFNPEPKFFDISEVKHPADRIAHYLSYQLPEGHAKAASASTDKYSILAGVDLLDVFKDKSASMNPLYRRHLQALREFEQTEDTAKRQLLKVASSSFETDPVSDSVIEALRDAEPSTVMYKLAQNRISLSFLDFCRYITGDSAETIMKSAGYKKASACILPSLFDTISQSPEMVDPLMAQFLPGETSGVLADPGNKDSLDKALSVLTERCGVNPDVVRPRVLQVIVVKKASDAEDREAWKSIAVPAEESYTTLAQAYGIFKTAFRISVEQQLGTNAVDDYFTGLIVGQNQ
jgi:hypothetical protein